MKEKQGFCREGFIQCPWCIRSNASFKARKKSVFLQCLSYPKCLFKSTRPKKEFSYEDKKKLYGGGSTKRFVTLGK